MVAKFGMPHLFLTFTFDEISKLIKMGKNWPIRKINQICFMLIWHGNNA
jgi:hypothetical protein